MISIGNIFSILMLFYSMNIYLKVNANYTISIKDFISENNSIFIVAYIDRDEINLINR